MTHGAMRRHCSTLWVTRFQRWRPRHQATHGAMRRHWSTVCANTLAKVEEETLGYTWGTTQPPVDAVTASRAEVDVETLGDTLSDATH